jgi:hypothetical protein
MKRIKRAYMAVILITMMVLAGRVLAGEQEDLGLMKSRRGWGSGPGQGFY